MSDSVTDLIAHDKAGERILEGLLVAAQKRLHDEGIFGDVSLFKTTGLGWPDSCVL